MSLRLLAIVCATASLAGLLFSGAAFARPELAQKSAMDRFTVMDADSDNAVSKEEFFKTYPQMKEAAFAAIDTDGNGSISAEEWAKFADGHGKGEAASAPLKMPSQTAPVTTGQPSGTAGAGAAVPELIMPSKDAQ